MSSHAAKEQAAAPTHGRWWRRHRADILLFSVTVIELVALFLTTDRLGLTAWIYVCSHLVVLAISLARPPAQVLDRSFPAAVAVLVSYSYSYAQVVLLNVAPGSELWPRVGLVVVVVGAAMSFVGLLSLGRCFGVRPAMRGLCTRGTYRFVRHPLYLAYIVQDIGYNLDTWSIGSLLLVAAGWSSIVYRVYAEERILTHHAGWHDYSQAVRYRLLPGIW